MLARCGQSPCVSGPKKAAQCAGTGANPAPATATCQCSSSNKRNRMKHRQTVCTCGFSEDAVLAAALVEADATEQQAVTLHIGECQACARLFAQYRRIQQVLTKLQDSREFEACLSQAVEKLQPRLESRLRKPLYYRQFASAVGELTIATSPQGLSLVAWQPKAVRLLASHAIREDGEALQALERELARYFAGV